MLIVLFLVSISDYCKAAASPLRIYAYLILDGDKTYLQVPTKIQPEVKRQLTVLGYEELAK
ncbi:hypothetical protein JNUCC42_03470 [Brevibacterium sp. JNUCC-42]|nr:hypothetical protein JNUCC42_03470 [Brevibacterium sp. JNUCC-42]